MRSQKPTLWLLASWGVPVTAFAFPPIVPFLFSGRSISVHRLPKSKSLKSTLLRPLYESLSASSSSSLSVEKGNEDENQSSTQSQTDGSASDYSKTALAVQETYPNSQILNMILTDHRPLGCTVEESMDIETDPSVVVVTKMVAGGHAETAGIQVGDVFIGVTGLFGDVTPVWKGGVEKM